MYTIQTNQINSNRNKWRKKRNNESHWKWNLTFYIYVWIAWNQFWLCSQNSTWIIRDKKNKQKQKQSTHPHSFIVTNHFVTLGGGGQHKFKFIKKQILNCLLFINPGNWTQKKTIINEERMSAPHKTWLPYREFVKFRVCTRDPWRDHGSEVRHN